MSRRPLLLLAATITGLALSPFAFGAGASGDLPEIPMVEVPAGCFDMGDRHGDGGSDEKPVHQVCVDSFFLGKYEVTEGIWRKISGSPPHSLSRGDSYPAAGLSWRDVGTFITRLRELTGKPWRLPTEAEWEYAVRGAGGKERYPSRGGVTMLQNHAWFSENSEGSPQPVGTREANWLGIHDMAGNVWEWVQDRYGSDYYRNSPMKNPAGDPFGVNRVIRGGSAVDSADYLRCSYRDYLGPDVRYPLSGFRLALSPE